MGRINGYPGDKRALYFECGAGISGDMALGALIHLGADAEAVKAELLKMDIGSFDLIPNCISKNGIRGVELDVIIRDESLRDAHAHVTYRHIKALIEGSGLSDNAKRMATNIFAVIGAAEAAVHGKNLDEVAFHEVGAPDSVIDIVGTAVAVDMMGVDRICCGPVHDGCGFIECRHGIIPVPVPAVMEMLKRSDIPLVIETDVTTEMVTPTGFGILEGLKAEFLPTFGVRPERIGYGFGKRDTGRFGAVRAILGEEYAQ
ncbi:MAG: LarC family nickel insertion protein [Clostridiales Family XIII bacterium]|jgi:uncharacterized protein (TIGR00299 family) protein|nr:LarC family nickel insertion protein [Clostridiales Family XIII bacterium]